MCESALDVGCGEASPLSRVSIPKFGVDADLTALQSAQKRSTHDVYALMDARNLGAQFRPGSFDAVVALDVIEHLPKEEGYKLLNEMIRIARRRVIILTPSGYLPQSDPDHKLQEHLAGWSSSDFRDKGFKVTGIGGPRFLRGEKHVLVWWPRAFWAMFAAVAHILYTHRNPDAAAALFAVKDVGVQ